MIFFLIRLHSDPLFFVLRPINLNQISPGRCVINFYFSRLKSGRWSGWSPRRASWCHRRWCGSPRAVCASPCPSRPCASWLAPTPSSPGRSCSPPPTMTSTLTSWCSRYSGSSPKPPAFRSSRRRWRQSITSWRRPPALVEASKVVPFLAACRLWTSE